VAGPPGLDRSAHLRRNVRKRLARRRPVEPKQHHLEYPDEAARHPFTASLLTLGAVVASAGEAAPKSVIHVVTVAWKAEATPGQIQAAIDGVKAMPAS